MRRKFAFGLGLAGVLAGAGAAVAQQFATDRPLTAPTSPALPSNFRPVTPGGVVPASATTTSPFGGPVTQQLGGGNPLPATPPPTDLEIRSALGANHPWAVKPEHGAFFICVKSYSRPNRPTAGDTGPTARVMAEELASEIRELYKVQTLLYEYVSPERRAEMASIAAARERARVFASQLDRYKQDAQLKGMTFLEDERVKIHFKTMNYNDQIAVLIGGFKTDEDARKALDTVRTWGFPKNKILMDGAVIERLDKNGKREFIASHLNPYLTAHVVPNPTIARAEEPVQNQSQVMDPFIVKLNEGRPYSLLTAKKAWTLGVKSFTAPVEITSKDSSNGGIMRNLTSGKGADVLKASAEQAEQLAESLRKMTDGSGKSLGFEAFVLHTRTASVVTIGQFDSPNDPEMGQLKQRLSRMTLKTSSDKEGFRPAGPAPEMFGNMMPVPIPH